MLVSIVHRVMGTGLATVGTALLIWWLAAAAGGEQSYAAFTDLFTLEKGGLNIPGWVLAVGLSFALFQHMASGVRHFFLDAGANFELKGNKTTAILTFVFSIAATAAFWAYLIWGK